MIYTCNWQTFSAKCLKVNISSFAGQVASVVITHLCLCSVKAVDSTLSDCSCVPVKLYT